MGVYRITMDQDRRDKLVAMFADIGLPEPTLTRKDMSVRYSFRFGLLRRLSVEVFEMQRSSGVVTYDLWIPLTRAGGELYEALQKRGYSV